MMKKKIIICAAVSAMLFGTVSYAASTIDSISFDVPSETLRVSGTADANDTYGLNMVTLEVLKPGVTPEKLKEMSDTEKKDAIVYIAQKAIGENGDYSFTYSPKTIEYGNHNIYVTDPNGKAVYKSILFITPNKNTSLVSDLNSALDAESAKTVLIDNSYLLDGVAAVDEISDTYSDKDVIADVAAMMAGKKYSDAQQITEYAVKCTVTAAVNYSADKAELTDNLDKFKIEIGFDENRIYTELFSEKADTLAENFVGKDYKDFDNFNTDFCDTTIIKTINGTVNYAGVPKILDAGREYLTKFNYEGYDKLSSTAKANVQKQIVNAAPYNTVDEIKTVFNNAVSGSNSSSGNQNVSGGGGGGGTDSTSKSGAVVSVPNNVGANKSDSVFSDLDNVKWAEESIVALNKKGIINGTGDGKFEPNRTVSREEFVKMLVCVYGLADDDALCAYDDVPENAWYYRYVASAKAAGIVNGISDSAFGTGTNITREDMAVMAYRAAQSKGVAFSSGGESFADEAMMSEYAKTAVYALKTAGVMNGRDGGIFAPRDFATRAEAAKIIYGLTKLGGTV